MEEHSTKTDADGTMLFAGEAWFDPIEAGIRDRVRGFIQELLEQELTAALGRTRHERAKGEPAGHRNGTRERQLLGSFGPVELSVPRARMAAEGGGTQEWRSATLPRHARMTRQVEALVAGAYLSGTNTRRVKRALAALLGGAVGKDVVSRTWRKVKTDWEAWSKRDLAGEDIVRLILDGTVVRVRLDRKATNISLLVVLGVRRDGQKVLLAVKNMGGESEAAWHDVLDNLIARGLRTPEFLVTDGGGGLDRALAALWPDVPAQPCTVHKHGNLAPSAGFPSAVADATFASFAHAPDALHEEVTAGCAGMIHAEAAKEAQARRRAFPGQMAAALPWRGHEPGGSWRATVRLPPPTPEPVEVGADHQRDRSAARGVQAPDQGAGRAAVGRTAAMLFWAEHAKVPSAQPKESKRRGCWRRARSPCAS